MENEEVSSKTFESSKHLKSLNEWKTGSWKILITMQLEAEPYSYFILKFQVI